jgi:hypothetical protein
MVAPNTKDRYPNAKTALRDLQAIDLARLPTGKKQSRKTIAILDLLRNKNTHALENQHLA